MLSRTRTVMSRQHINEHETEVTFVAAYDDTQKIYRQVVLSHSDWTELGSPQEITVAIEPGDTLNPSNVKEAVFGGN